MIFSRDLPISFICLRKAMSHQLFANDIISYTFVTELSTHSNCFVDFYQVVEKQLCLETLEFFFLGLDYKLSPACQRRVTEKQIFEYFVAIKAKRQINISAKLRQTVCDRRFW